MAWDHLGFLKPYKSVKNGIFVPRYYDPEVWNKLQSFPDLVIFDLDIATLQVVLDMDRLVHPRLAGIPV